jgi:3-oxoacyl-[acyl-carrier protein] reductase
MVLSRDSLELVEVANSSDAKDHPMQISFKGKKVIVAGGSRGIGRSIALAFAAE